MEQEVEIEFKNLLTPDEFFRISNELSLQEESFITQVNHYFDTPSFSLKQHRCALRIREKNGSRKLTLKQPHPDGLLETHQSLTESEFDGIMKENKMVDGDICSILAELKIQPEDIVYLGTLTTKRAELPYKDGILVLDENQYLSVTDFELEYEAKERQQGEMNFKELLNTYGIPERSTLNKIQRFFEAKNS
ncbi:CYTH domain-containing protein [Fictibacillus fluitans]|uniref:CYTH domain-containing protein n=1 Tax=Fictibacillus fluitans TaxID=3058422 RepID=A0ABT8HS97_9BACL|nr:CYTH domain-containing protein [Fictibacillus sp. NE201]MDN4523647.1 CYTH domain-containing protein [Fictibacillus sp. NE201]